MSFILIDYARLDLAKRLEELPEIIVTDPISHVSQGPFKVDSDTTYVTPPTNKVLLSTIDKVISNRYYNGNMLLSLTSNIARSNITRISDVFGYFRERAVSRRRRSLGSRLGSLLDPRLRCLRHYMWCCESPYWRRGRSIPAARRRGSSSAAPSSTTTIAHSTSTTNTTASAGDSVVVAFIFTINRATTAKVWGRPRLLTSNKSGRRPRSGPSTSTRAVPRW